MPDFADIDTFARLQPNFDLIDNYDRKWLDFVRYIYW